METALAAKVSLLGQVGRFVLHYFEMCIPMCIGFAVGDLVYFWVAGPDAAGGGIRGGATYADTVRRPHRPPTDKYAPLGIMPGART